MNKIKEFLVLEVNLLTFKNNNENNRFHEIAHGITAWLQIISLALVIFLIVR